MKIVCIGGGPAGLYFALLMKQQDPAHEIIVVERNRPYDTFGYLDVEWPKQYGAAKAQLERNLERERTLAAQGTGLSPLAQAKRALGV